MQREKEREREREREAERDREKEREREIEGGKEGERMITSLYREPSHVSMCHSLSAAYITNPQNCD